MPEQITIRDVITRPPSHIGMPDVETFEQVTARLGVLGRESGGVAAQEMLAAVAQGGEELLTAQCAEPVRQRLLGAVSEAHRLAEWASGDVGGHAEHARAAPALTWRVRSIPAPITTCAAERWTPSCSPRF